MALRQWQSQVNLDAMDFGSYRLLPLLWKRVASQNWSFPRIDLIKGVYRRTWYANQLQLSRLLEITRDLQRENCEAMWLKGAALAIHCYDDIGVRPMDDVDLLVKTDQALQAIRQLVNADWQPAATPLTVSRTSNPRDLPVWIQSARPMEMLDDAYLSARHGHCFSNKNAGKIDLHWRLVQEFETPVLETSCWNSPDHAHWRNTRILVPNAAAHLVFLLLHGCRWNPTPAIRWIADATALIRSQYDKMDWEQFQEFASVLQVSKVLAPMLNFLHEEYDVLIPQPFLDEFANQSSSARSIRTWDILQCPPGVPAAFLEVSLLRSRYRQFRQKYGRAANPGSFPGYIRHALGAPNIPSLIRFTTKEIFQRVFVKKAR